MDENTGRNERRLEDEKNRSGRLPPGQVLTEKFPVLHYGPIPSFDPVSWDLRVWGEVGQELRWNWQEFNELPRTRLDLDLHCVTRWSRYDTCWEGVSLAALVSQGIVKLKPTARYLMQHAEYGFTVNLPLEVALQPNFLLATHYGGQPLTPEHGFPLRAVAGAIPGRPGLKDVYLWKGAKWLRGLEFMAADRPGFWERAGYSNSADIWKEERFD